MPSSEMWPLWHPFTIPVVSWYCAAAWLLRVCGKQLIFLMFSWNQQVVLELMGGTNTCVYTPTHTEYSISNRKAARKNVPGTLVEQNFCNYWFMCNSILLITGHNDQMSGISAFFSILYVIKCELKANIDGKGKVRVQIYNFWKRLKLSSRQ